MNMHVSEFVQRPYGDSCHNMTEPTVARTVIEKAVGMEQLILIDSPHRPYLRFNWGGGMVLVVCVALNCSTFVFDVSFRCYISHIPIAGSSLDGCSVTPC